MKKLFLLLLFLCSTQVFAQGAFGSGGDLEPLGPYPIVKQKYIQGGLHVLSDTSLLASYLRDSVMVYQKGDGKFYRWESGAWAEVATGSGGWQYPDLTPSTYSPGAGAGDTLLKYAKAYSPGSYAYVTGYNASTPFSFQGIDWGNANSPMVNNYPSGASFTSNTNAGMLFEGGNLQFYSRDLTTLERLVQLNVNSNGILIRPSIDRATSNYKGLYTLDNVAYLDSLRLNVDDYTYLPRVLVSELVEDSLDAYSPSIPNLQQVINVNGNIEFEDELEWVTDEAIVFLSTDFTLSTVLGAGSIATGGISAKYFVSNGGTDGLDFRTRAYFRNSPYGLTPPTDSNIVPFSIIKALISDSLAAYNSPIPTLQQVTDQGSSTTSGMQVSGSFSAGTSNTFTGTLNAAIGRFHTVATNGFSYGENNESGQGAFSGGNSSRATGWYSNAQGTALYARSVGEAAFGIFGTDYSATRTMSFQPYAPTDRIFSIGNGTNDLNRNDILNMKVNGTTIIDTTWSYKSKMSSYNFQSNDIPHSDWVKNTISDSLAVYSAPIPTLAQVTASGAATSTDVSFNNVTFTGNWTDNAESTLTDGQTLVSKSGVMMATDVAETISHTEAINFPSIAAGSFQSTTVTITGVEVGDVIVMTPDKNAFTDNLQFQAWVNGANTVAVQAYNYTGAAIDPVANSFHFKILK